VGFFGVQLVARSGRPLGNLPVVRALGDEVDWEQQGAGDWWFCRVHGQQPPPDEETVAALVAEVAGPVAIGYVHDSDVALVWLAAPGQPVAGFVLNPEAARGYGLPVDDAAQSAAPAAVTAWAGPGVDADAVAEVLATEHVFAEEGVVRLAAAWGAVPAGELGTWVGAG
jgi:hypothetical protein